MTNSPATVELVTAVREFIEQRVAPSLEGHTAFHARVAVNTLAIVERELTLGADAGDRERVRLAALLGHDGTAQALNTELATAIRSGTMALDDQALLDHLRRTTLDKVAVDQPHYSGFKDAMARWGKDMLETP